MDGIDALASSYYSLLASSQLQSSKERRLDNMMRGLISAAWWLELACDGTAKGLRFSLPLGGNILAPGSPRPRCQGRWLW